MDTISRPWEGDGYKVSPYNFEPQVRQPYAFREPVVIQDATLLKMDHLETARLYSPEEYIEVAQLLDEVGIQETCFLTGQYRGTPKDESIWNGLKAVAGAGLKLKVRGQGFFASWGPGEYKEHIDRIADCGVAAIGLSASPPHILRQYRTLFAGSDFEQRLSELPDAIEYARKRGLEVSVSSAHAVLEDMETLIDRHNYYIDSGAEGLLLADSKGFATPDATRYLVSKLRAGLKRDIPIYYHAHDVFGLGTALALAATCGGAYPQVSVNGAADGGFASLEEVVMSLELLYGVRTGVNLKLLAQLSRTVERITGIPNPTYKAIVGDHTTIAGYPWGYVGALKGKSFLELEQTLYDPKMVGMRPQLVMTYSLLSPEAVKTKLEQMGLPSGEGEVKKARDALGKALDSLGNKFPVMLNDVEVEQVCREALGR